MAISKSKNIVIEMGTKKRGPGRPRKDVVLKEADLVNEVGLPGLFQPTEHDVADELSRLDSFTYGNYH